MGVNFSLISTMHHFLSGEEDLVCVMKRTRDVLSSIGSIFLLCSISNALLACHPCIGVLPCLARGGEA